MYVKHLLRHAAKGSTELFFAPAPMRGGGMPSEADAMDAAVIWADVDQEFTEEQWALIERLDATVNESGGVGRHHVFVPLDVPHPPHVIKELNQVLRVALDGDSKQSPASFLRVPGSWNRKADPVLCRTVRLSSSRQTLPSIAQALRTGGESVGAQSRVSGERETPTGALSALTLPEMPEGFDYWARDLTSQRMRKVVREWNQRFTDGRNIQRHKATMAIVKDAIRYGLTVDEAYGFAMECSPLLDKQEEENGYSIAKDVARTWRREAASATPSRAVTEAAASESAGVRDEPAVTSADDDDSLIGEVVDGGDAFEERVAEELERLRIREEAQRRHRARERGEAKIPDILVGGDFLARELPAERHRIADLWPIDGRIMFNAKDKAGKTTTRNNLIRSLCDGSPFLGQFAMKVPEGRIIIVDNELSATMGQEWLQAQGILNPDKFAVVHLRGLMGSFDIRDKAVRKEWAERFKRAGSEDGIIILDCLYPLMLSLALDMNTQAGYVLEAFDSLLDESGTKEGTIIHHMGHQNERAVGDSRLGGWPDATWNLTLKKADDRTSPRLLSAYGRGVSLGKTELVYDPATHHLTTAAVDLGLTGEGDMGGDGAGGDGSGRQPLTAAEKRAWEVIQAVPRPTSKHRLFVASGLDKTKRGSFNRSVDNVIKKGYAEMDDSGMVSPVSA
ncbi:AAA family ATPase [Streptomyces caniscabiei]|uniref:AAA family ATPase n=2 Tax=Streptomyces caniscabiei TaxID=2746961 RepID=UPI0018726221|nr:AAA family ATPase [Streptomyces caniscabiei]MBE4797395.1 AAA family ATPase [Streptomyces caniscabiei]